MKWASLALLAGITLAACGLERVSAAQTVELGRPFSLRAGQSAALPSADLRVGFDRVVADSRCPKGEQCLRAGDARVQVWLQRGSAPRQWVELVGPAVDAQRQAPQMQAMGHRLTFVRLDPHPVSGRPVPLSDYVLTLGVQLGAAEESAQ